MDNADWENFEKKRTFSQYKQYCFLFGTSNWENCIAVFKFLKINIDKLTKLL